MFGGFSNRIDPATKRRMALSFAGALVVYVALGGAVVAGFGGAVMATNDKEHDVDVTFFKALPPPPPPLPPPPAPALEPAKAAAPAPAPAPKSMPKPIAPKSNTPAAPKEIPKDKPEEGKDPGKSETPVKPSDDPLPGSSPSGSGNGSGDPNATGTGDPNSKGTGTGPGDGTGTGSAPVVLPPGAIAPELVGALVTEADYPRGAREARIEGVVKVKVVVQIDGTVTLVKFLQHDENFDQAVLAILKRIRYKPAVYNGHPIAVYKNLSFPFEMD